MRTNIKKTIWGSFGLIFVILVPNVSWGAKAYHLNADMPPNKFTHVERVSIAKDLKQIFSQLRENLPNLSPSQKEWVKTEMEYIDTNPYSDEAGRRWTNLQKNPIFQINSVKDRMTMLIKLIDPIIEENLPLKIEMRHWAWLSYAMISPPPGIDKDLERIMNRDKILKSREKISKTISRGAAGIVHKSSGGGILKEIILYSFLEND